MREIKFRAWNKERKIIERIDGDSLYFANGRIYSVYEEAHFQGELNFQKDDVTDDYELQEYTGVHDSTEDETEIYEHDKIKFYYKGKEYIGDIEMEGWL